MCGCQCLSERESLTCKLRSVVSRIVSFTINSYICVSFLVFRSLSLRRVVRVCACVRAVSDWTPTQYCIDAIRDCECVRVLCAHVDSRRCVCALFAHTFLSMKPHTAPLPFANNECIIIFTRNCVRLGISGYWFLTNSKSTAIMSRYSLNSVFTNTAMRRCEPQVRFHAWSMNANAERYNRAIVGNIQNEKKRRYIDILNSVLRSSHALVETCAHSNMRQTRSNSAIRSTGRCVTRLVCFHVT